MILVEISISNYHPTQTTNGVKKAGPIGSAAAVFDVEAANPLSSSKVHGLPHYLPRPISVTQIGGISARNSAPDLVSLLCSKCSVNIIVHGVDEHTACL